MTDNVGLRFLAKASKKKNIYIYYETFMRIIKIAALSFNSLLSTTIDRSWYHRQVNQANYS
jgi:hypothetical protein